MCMYVCMYVCMVNLVCSVSVCVCVRKLPKHIERERERYARDDPKWIECRVKLHTGTYTYTCNQADSNANAILAATNILSILSSPSPPQHPPLHP